MDLSMRPAPFVAAVAGIVALGLMALGTAPVLAHEFTVGILLDPGATRSAAFMRGFRLAVDQSPDVSHPRGVEGGDHLGSIDVVMEVRDRLKRPDRSAGSALQLIRRKGVPIIVADVSPAVLTALLEPVVDAETVLIAVGDTDGVELPVSPFFFAAAERAGTSALLADRKILFEDAFVTAYGRPPSAAATRGYIAGRLVDIGVEATDEDPFDEETLTAALLSATGAPEMEISSQRDDGDSASPDDADSVISEDLAGSIRHRRSAR